MSLADKAQAHNGQTLGFPSGQYVGECLSLIKVCLQEAGLPTPVAPSGGASSYWQLGALAPYFTFEANTPSNIAPRGSIMVWNTNVGAGYGHIAIVESANATGFNAWTQNWGGKQTHLQSYTYPNTIGFMRLKGDDMIETKEQADLLTLAVFDRHLNDGEEQFSIGKTWQARLAECETSPEKQSLRQHVRDLAERVDAQDLQIETMQDGAVAVGKQIQDLTDEAANLKKENDAHEKAFNAAINDRDKALADLKTCQAGMPTQSIFDVIKAWLSGFRR